jgi:alkanesulfonate monooxygenase SsuD/methylene tetrahydromethanopterin reductase-like flavin-dependent oxidoreductase (luciferase family)
MDRNPLVLAKQLATLDVLSGGSLIVGMGAGWLREEYAALDVPFDQRISRIKESLQVMRTLWGGQAASHKGEFWSFDNMVVRPPPRQGADLRCWYGGNSLTLLSRLAPVFAGWLPYEPSPEEIADGVRVALEARSRAGLDSHFTIAAVSRLPLSDRVDLGRTRSILASYHDAGVECLVVLASMGRSVAENLIRVERLAASLDSLPHDPG